jgi:hypothetical protein
MASEILGWSQRDLALNVTEVMGSLIQQDGSRGLVFFHASLKDWLEDPKRSGPYCSDDNGKFQLADFLWADYKQAGPDGSSPSDRHGEEVAWLGRSKWNRAIRGPDQGARYWLNMTTLMAKEAAERLGRLDLQVEYARRYVALCAEAYGTAHDIFEFAKMDWDELQERLRASQ